MEDKIIAPGIPDAEFIRGNVPMTKEEVRAASISKLRLEKDSVVYDIGSGTGSVSVEIARLSKGIKVFAVDSNPEAAELTKKNLEKFALKNAEVVQGEAPFALESLPFPTRAFIGGSDGKIMEILDSYAGVLPFTEKASPEVIKRETGLSKAAFKRAIGTLYKHRKITLNDGKIRKV